MSKRKYVSFTEEQLDKLKTRFAANGLDIDCLLGHIDNLLGVVNKMETDAIKSGFEHGDGGKPMFVDEEVKALRSLLTAMLANPDNPLSIGQVASALGEFQTGVVQRMANWAMGAAEHKKHVQDVERIGGTGDDRYVKRIKSLLQSIARYEKDDTSPHRAPLADGLVTARADSMAHLADDLQRMFEAVKKDAPELAENAERLMQQVDAAKRGNRGKMPDGDDAIHPAIIEFVNRLEEHDKREYGFLERAGYKRSWLENHLTNTYSSAKIENAPTAFVADFKKTFDLQAMGIKTDADVKAALYWVMHQGDNVTSGSARNAFYSRVPQRKFIALDPAKEYLFFQRWGNRNTLELIKNNRMALINQRVAVERFGFGGLAQIERLYKKLIGDAINEGKFGKDSPEHQAFDKDFRYRLDAVIQGHHDTAPAVPNLAATYNFADSLANVMYYLSSLWSPSDFSRIIDNAARGLPLRVAKENALSETSSLVRMVNNGPVKRSLDATMMAAKALAKDEEGRSILSMVADGFDFNRKMSLMQAMHRYDLDEIPSSFMNPETRGYANKLNNAARAVNAFHQKWNPLWRAHHLLNNMDAAVNHQILSLSLQLGDFSELRANNPIYARRLERAGITEQDFEILRKLKINKKGIFDPGELQTLDSALYHKVQGFYQVHANQVLYVPDAISRMVARGGNRADTYMGLGMRALMKAKTSLLAASREAFHIYRAEQGLLGRGEKTGQFLVTGAILMIGGAIAAQLQEIARGRDPFAWDSKYLWGRAFSSVGPMAIPADTIMATGMWRDDWAQHGGGSVDFAREFVQKSAERNLLPLTPVFAGQTADLIVNGIIETFEELGIKDENFNNYVELKSERQVLEGLARRTPAGQFILTSWASNWAIRNYFMDADPKYRRQLERTREREGRVDLREALGGN